MYCKRKSNGGIPKVLDIGYSKWLLVLYSSLNFVIHFAGLKASFLFIHPINAVKCSCNLFLVILLSTYVNMWYVMTKLKLTIAKPIIILTAIAFEVSWLYIVIANSMRVHISGKDSFMDILHVALKWSYSTSMVLIKLNSTIPIMRLTFFSNDNTIN